MAGCPGRSFWACGAVRGMSAHSTRLLTTSLSTGRTLPITRGRTSMPRKRPPFVELWRDRHGKVRVYFRKAKGPRLPLPSDITSEEFTAAYQAALAGQLAPPPKHERRELDKPGTIAVLIRSYRCSAAFLGLRETTKIGYASRIEILRCGHG